VNKIHFRMGHFPIKSWGMDLESSDLRHAGFKLATHILCAALIPFVIFGYLTAKYHGGFIPSVVDVKSYPFMPYGLFGCVLVVVGAAVALRTAWKYGLYDETW
jgi:hypothetical protein